MSSPQKIREEFITTLFGPAAHALAEEKLHELQAKGGSLMLSKDAYIKQQEKVILSTLDKQLAWVGSALRQASAILHERLEALPSSKREVIRDELTRAFEGFADNINKSRDTLEPLQVMLGISRETMLWMYSVGRETFTEKRYEEAQGIFFLLTMLNAFVADYWTAFGMSQRHTDHEEEALYSFAMAICLQPDKPLPRYHSADIYCKLGKIDDACIELEELSRIVADLQDREWSETCDVLRSKIYMQKIS